MKSTRDKVKNSYFRRINKHNKTHTMIDVRVTIGIYETLKDAEVVHMRLGALPRIGETLLMTPELKKMADKKIKEWNMDPYTRVNYVKCIAYDQQPTPVLMLSTNPNLVNVDCFAEGQKTFTLSLPSVPRIGEEIISLEEKQFFVASVIYAPWGAFARLSTERPLVPVDVVRDKRY